MVGQVYMDQHVISARNKYRSGDIFSRPTRRLEPGLYATLSVCHAKLKTLKTLKIIKTLKTTSFRTI
jgi:hypothetical protein